MKKNKALISLNTINDFFKKHAAVICTIVAIYFAISIGMGLVPKTKDFDEPAFIVMVEESILLSKQEKEDVIKAIPRLSMDQINELIGIFKEEKEKFVELEKEYPEDVEKLKEINSLN